MHTRSAALITPPTPAEMSCLVSRAGLTLNAGQMADLVLSWRLLAEQIAQIQRDRPLRDDWTVSQAAPLRQTAPHEAEDRVGRTQARMRAANIGFPTIAEASRLIAARKLSPTELVRALLARIESGNDRLTLS